MKHLLLILLSLTMLVTSCKKDEPTPAVQQQESDSAFLFEMSIDVVQDNYSILAVLEHNTGWETTEVNKLHTDSSYTSFYIPKSAIELSVGIACSKQLRVKYKITDLIDQRIVYSDTTFQDGHSFKHVF